MKNLLLALPISILLFTRSGVRAHVMSPSAMLMFHGSLFAGFDRAPLA